MQMNNAAAPDTLPSAGVADRCEIVLCDFEVSAIVDIGGDYRVIEVRPARPLFAGPV